MVSQAICMLTQTPAGRSSASAILNGRLQPLSAIRRAAPGWKPTRGQKHSVKASAEKSSSSGPVFLEDVKYLCKFGIFSVVGAAAIKYGSLLFPNVTVPDLSLALVLVWSPVLASVFLLAVAGARQDPGSK